MLQLWNEMWLQYLHILLRSLCRIVLGLCLCRDRLFSYLVLHSSNETAFDYSVPHQEGDEHSARNIPGTTNGNLWPLILTNSRCQLTGWSAEAAWRPLDFSKQITLVINKYLFSLNSKIFNLIKIFFYSIVVFIRIFILVVHIIIIKS